MAIGDQDEKSCIPRTPRAQLNLYAGYNYTKEVRLATLPLMPPIYLPFQACIMSCYQVSSSRLAIPRDLICPEDDGGGGVRVRDGHGPPAQRRRRLRAL